MDARVPRATDALNTQMWWRGCSRPFRVATFANPRLPVLYGHLDEMLSAPTLASGALWFETVDLEVVLSSAALRVVEKHRVILDRWWGSRSGKVRDEWLKLGDDPVPLRLADTTAPVVGWPVVVGVRLGSISADPMIVDYIRSLAWRR